MNCNYKVKIKDIQNKYQFKIFCKTYDDTEIQGDIEALNSDVEALQEENLYLNNLVEQAFDKKEVEGEELSIDDTINAKMEVGLEGNTTQKTTTGKNKYEGSQDFSGIWVNSSVWVTDTNTYNGLVVKKRANNWDGLYKEINVEANKTYTFSFYAKVDAPRECAIYVVGGTATISDFQYKNINPTTNWTRYSATFTPSTNGTVKARIENKTSVSSNYTYICGYQLEEGSTASSYEKYTGGVASPNPSYPSNVNVVTGDNAIVVSNKNLFNGEFNNLAFELGNIGQVTSLIQNNNYLGAYCKVKEGETYSISRGKLTNRFVVAVGTEIPTTNSRGVVVARNDSAYKIENITIPSGYSYIYLYLSNNGETSTDYKLMIEQSSTSTSLVEHQEQTFQVNLGNIELCKIGDYQDYFYKSNNKWYKHSEIGKVRLSENWNWGIQGNTNYQVTLTGENKLGLALSGLGISNYFNVRTSGNDIYLYPILQSGTDYLRISNATDEWETANDLKTFLTNNDIYFYYPLATPTETEITDTTLISQLEALKTAMSYAEQTNISQINDDVPFILQVTALASYNSRILALENAILNANRSTPVENTRKSNEVIEEPKEEVVDDNKDENIIKEEK